MQIALDLVARDLKLEPPNNLTPAQRAMWDSAYASENAALRRQGLSPEALARWKYQRYIADYMRVIAALDQQVGRVLRRLDETGLAKNTIVVYSSDQGFFLGDHGWFDKRWMYEESFRTPLLIKWPGVVRTGSTNRDLVMNLDVAETFLDVAGVKAPAFAPTGTSSSTTMKLASGSWRVARLPIERPTAGCGFAENARRVAILKVTDSAPTGGAGPAGPQVPSPAPPNRPARSLGMVIARYTPVGTDLRPLHPDERRRDEHK
ncbi:MAG: sulfatase/phosphatase domain-containing protein [Gemmatimonadaceae bacterium]